MNLHQPKAQQMPFGSRGGRVNPDTGAFEIQNVFAGSYVIVATQFSPDMNGGAWTARQAVEVTERPVQVSLTLQKPVDVRGEFVVEGNQDFQKGHLSLTVMPEEQAAPVPPPRVETQPDGTFLMRNTPQGRWVLHVYGPNVYLRSVEAGGQMLQGNVLDTTSGVTGPVRVVVSTRTARVQGRGTPGKLYSLIREDGDPRLTHPFVSHADGQGTVRVEGLPPGRYGVYEGTVPDETMRLDTVTLAEEQVLDLDMTIRSGR